VYLLLTTAFFSFCCCFLFISSTYFLLSLTNHLSPHGPATRTQPSICFASLNLKCSLKYSYNLHYFIYFYSDEQRWISGIPLQVLLPQTSQYITYEGSLTQPQCQETVTWVIFNKPIYITERQVSYLYVLKKIKTSLLRN
jgi:hypothetical protein